jgi:shikimate dehydrogenase
MDDTHLRYFAVFGNPVLHSRSPQLYNPLFKRDKIKAIYTRIFASSGKAVCEIIRGLGLAGANITTPFKEEAIPWLDRISPDAEKIGAVNTIVNVDGELSGYNTDASGVTGSLLEAGADPSGKKCLVMGAGGAGKAAVMGLVNSGAFVTIANRDISKAAGIAEKAGCSYAGLDEAAGRLNEFSILVLTLPPGVYPFKYDQLPPGMTIADANYRSPSETSLLDGLQCKVIRGDRWLLHQGVGAYKLFTGRIADTSIMEEGLKNSLDPEKLMIRVIKDYAIKDDITKVLTAPYADLIIDGREMDDLQIKMITDEERAKAFGSKR